MGSWSTLPRSLVDPLEELASPPAHVGQGGPPHARPLLGAVRDEVARVELAHHPVEDLRELRVRERGLRAPRDPHQVLAPAGNAEEATHPLEGWHRAAAP